MHSQTHAGRKDWGSQETHLHLNGQVAQQLPVLPQGKASDASDFPDEQFTTCVPMQRWKVT